MKLLMGFVCAWPFVIILMDACASLIGTKHRIKHIPGKLGRLLKFRHHAMQAGLHEDISSRVGSCKRDRKQSVGSCKRDRNKKNEELLAGRPRRAASDLWRVSRT